MYGCFNTSPGGVDINGSFGRRLLLYRFLKVIVVSKIANLVLFVLFRSWGIWKKHYSKANEVRTSWTRLGEF